MLLCRWKNLAIVSSMPGHFFKIAAIKFKILHRIIFFLIREFIITNTEGLEKDLLKQKHNPISYWQSEVVLLWWFSLFYEQNLNWHSWRRYFLTQNTESLLYSNNLYLPNAIYKYQNTPFYSDIQFWMDEDFFLISIKFYALY